MIQVGMGYPEQEDEIKILQGKRTNLMDTVKEVITAFEIETIRRQVKRVYIEESVCRYITEIAKATRESEEVALGISPRGSVAISMMAKASAFMAGRDYVIPNDVQSVLMETMEHRLLLNARAKLAKVTQRDIIRKILVQVEVPQIKDGTVRS